MVENSFFPRFFGLFGPFFSFFFGPTSVIFKKKVLATLMIADELNGLVAETEKVRTEYRELIKMINKNLVLWKNYI